MRFFLMIKQEKYLWGSRRNKFHQMMKRRSFLTGMNGAFFVSLILFETYELFCSFWLFLVFSRFVSINYCPILLALISWKMLYFSVHEWKNWTFYSVISVIASFIFYTDKIFQFHPSKFKFCHRKANQRFYIKMNF